MQEQRNTMDSLRRELDRNGNHIAHLEKELAAMRKDVIEILEYLNQMKGSVRMVFVLAGAAATVATIVTAVIAKVAK